MELDRLIVDVSDESKSLIYDAELEEAFPSLAQSFDNVDETYADLSYNTPALLGGQQFEVAKNDYGHSVKCSVIADEETSKSRDVLVVFSPFSDIEPRSGGESIAEYAKLEKAGHFKKFRVQPHSWNQTTKSRTIHDLLKEEGLGMPVITIFSPIDESIFSPSELENIRNGDFTPQGYIAQKAIAASQELIHGKGSETQIGSGSVHFYGPSLGASNAIGAATAYSSWHTKYGTEVMPASVSAQELIIGPKKLIPDLAKSFINKDFGAESDEVVSDEVRRIVEPLMRRDLEAHGTEIQMGPQILEALLKTSYLRGLTRPSFTIASLEKLQDEMSVLVATAANSNISWETPLHLLGQDKVSFLSIQAVQGQKANHDVNEHVVASSTVALLGVSKAAAAKSRD